MVREFVFDNRSAASISVKFEVVTPVQAAKAIIPGFCGCKFASLIRPRVGEMPSPDCLFSTSSHDVMQRLVVLLLIRLTSALDLHECSHPLGMSNRKIRDEQISASSSFDLQSTGPQHARAHQESGSGAWCPKNQINSQSKEWLQISFGRDTVITAIETQGRYDEGRGMEYATAFRIEYWRPSLNGWASYKDDAEVETVPGNTDTKTPVKHVLDGGIIVRRIRIVPISNSTRTVCLRVELFGCSFDDSLISYAIDQGDMQGARSFHDVQYDGTVQESHLLGGIGKLYDGQAAPQKAYETPHKWVGWKKRRNDHVHMQFVFSELRNITAVLIHTANEFSKNARMFASANVLFSHNGHDYSNKITHKTEDNDSEEPRWIKIPVNHKTGKNLKIRLHFASDSEWIFVSEISFESNYTAHAIAIDDINVPETIEFFTVTENENGVGFMITLLFSVLIFASVVLAMVLYKKRDRVKASSPSPSFNVATREIHLTIDGTTIKRVSPSTYQMTRDNLQNALIEKMPIDSAVSDYAEPDISVCSESTTPLLYGMEGQYESKRANPLSSLIKYSDYGEVYCTTLPEIARDKLQFIEKVGHGEFGEVDLCQLDNRKVAVKRLYSMSEADEFAFHREIRVLGSLKHPNVVEVVGVSTIQKPILCIMEYMDNGDLKSYINKSSNIDTSTCISICTQLAAGLAYLESCNFVHRDIAARNCLVDREGNVKIADFGMARSLYSQEYYKVEGKFVLPIRWMAWEALLMGKFSTSSDVWAFGVTMWEVFMLCKEKPFLNLSDDQVVENLQKMSDSGELQTSLQRPSLCPNRLFVEFMKPCWTFDASKRPSFEVLHLNLQSLIHTSPQLSY
ncbi:unnamed protein product [Caenorhabditis auriculariae]|uniref:receptor protein-tyrosine kinase n=1 Tax=Caenorhabditis auriculariae TaxID=2777116 RepID=A0A8S1GR90_9PELO|nr:unnamed protein product [Caenorhabditis auriculariae]